MRSIFAKFNFASKVRECCFRFPLCSTSMTNLLHKTRHNFHVSEEFAEQIFDYSPKYISRQWPLRKLTNYRPLRRADGAFLVASVAYLRYSLVESDQREILSSGHTGT